MGLLPLPFEIIQKLLPLINDTERNQYLLGKKTTEEVINEISMLSGKVGSYIEMPLLHAFDTWHESDDSIKDWLDEACQQTDHYIHFRSGQGNAENHGFFNKVHHQAEAYD